MVQAEWIEGSWGSITFSKPIDDYHGNMPIDIFYEDSTKAGADFFQDLNDNKKLNFILDRLTHEHILIEVNDSKNHKNDSFELAKIRINMDTYVDTMNVSLTPQLHNEVLQIKEHRIVPLKIIFSSLIDIKNSNANFTIIQDSTNIQYTANGRIHYLSN